MIERQIQDTEQPDRDGERSRRGRGEDEQPGERSRRGRGHSEHHGKRGNGAQTFRRGRILIFLEQMQNRRATLVRQLGQEEFRAIHQMISGELKAIDQVIDEYIQLFELYNEEKSPNQDAESE